MANRFRAAIKGTSEEILSAGKQNVVVADQDNSQESVYSSYKNSDIGLPEIQEKSLESLDSVIGSDSYEKQFNDNLNNGEVALFLRQKVSNNIFELRINRIKDIINSLVSCGSNSKHIMLCDLEENMKYWIEAIKSSLPNAIGDRLIFKTNNTTDNSSIHECIICYQGEKDIHDRNNLIVYNFMKRNNIRPDVDSKYSELVQVGHMLNEQSFNGFKRFVGQFDYIRLDSSIDDCYELYIIINYGIDGCDIDSVSKASNFLDKYASAENFVTLAKQIENIIGHMNSDMDEKLAAAVIKLAFKIAVKSQEKSLLGKIYTYTMECIQSLIKKGTDNTSRVTTLYNQVRNLGERTGYSLEEYIISEGNINRLTNYVLEVEPKYVKFYFSMVMEQLKSKGSMWKESDLYIKFINICMSSCVKNIGQLEEIVTSVEANGELVANLIVQYFDTLTENVDEREKVVAYFIGMLNKYDNKQVKLIRNTIYKNTKGSSLIIEEYKYRLKNSENKSEFFWTYNSEVFDSIAGFKESNFSDVLVNYLDIIKGEPIYKKELPVIFNMVAKNQITLSNDRLVSIIDVYESDIPLGKPDQVTQLILMTISKIKRDKGIATSGNVTALSEIGVSFENAKTSDDIRKIINNIPALNNVAVKRYAQFINWCIDILSNNKAARTSDILEFYKKVRIVKEDKKDLFVETIITNSVQRDKARKIQGLIFITLNYLVERQTPWGNSGEYGNFVTNCMASILNSKAELESILDSVSDIGDYFINMLLEYHGQAALEDNAAVHYFVKKTEKNGEKWASNIRNLIITYPNGGNFLYEEYKDRLNIEKDKSKFFWAYYVNAFEAIEEYRKKFFSDAVQYYLGVIEGGSNYSEECTNILELVADNKVQLKPSVLSKIIKNYEESISISFPTVETEEIMDEIIRIKEQNGVITNPDIIRMIKFGIYLQNMKESQDIVKAIETASLNINGIDEKRYTEYINWSLSLFVDKINLLENSARIKKLYYIKEYNAVFGKLYNEQLFKQIKSKAVKFTKDQVKLIISEMDNDVHAACDTLVLFYGQCAVNGATKEAVDLFVNFVDKAGAQKQIQIYKYLSSLSGGNDLLFEEFSQKIEASVNPSEYFWAYCAKVLHEIIGYREKCYARIIERYLDIMTVKGKFAEECFKIVNLITEERIDLSYDLLVRVITGCESTLQMATPDGRQQVMISNMARFKRQKNIITSPDLIGLVDFGTMLENIKEPSIARTLLENSKLNLNNIDIMKYEELLDWCLPKLIGCVNEWSMHVKIKSLLCEPKREGFFFIKYTGLLDNVLENYKAEGARIFARFILAFNQIRTQCTEETLIQVRANVLNILSRQSDATLKEMDSCIRTEAELIANKESILRDWDQMFRKALPNAKHDKNIFGKMFKK